jgi:hypothetical protein
MRKDEEEIEMKQNGPEQNPCTKQSKREAQWKQRSKEHVVMAEKQQTGSG